LIAQVKQLLQQEQAKTESLENALCELQTERIQREKFERDLIASQQLLQRVMDTLPEAIFWKDLNSVYLGCNQKLAEDAGVGSPAQIVGKTDYDLAWKQEESDFFRECDRRVMLADRSELGIVEPLLRSDGKQIWLETNKAPLHNVKGEVIGILGTYQDITARQEAENALQILNQKLELQAVELGATLEQLQQSQLQMIQQEKMSALGNMMAGVAHEINNPVGFLSGNLGPAQDYVQDLFELLDLYEQKWPQPGSDITEKVEDIDLAYLREDLPKALHSMHEGIKRISNISTSLRTFSRADTEHRVSFHLYEGLDSTILILKHRLKANERRPDIEVVQNYHEMPAIPCFPGQLNQVFMNLLANAIDALDESNEGKSFAEIQVKPNCITVTTELSADHSADYSADQQWAVITIKDNGIGMSEATQHKMFENLFTTKGVGKGTGLGLAIARQIIVEKHNGTIDVHSVFGQGTEFVIKIPVETVSPTSNPLS
jgi:PAS domain S-box-containing protein